MSCLLSANIGANACSDLTAIAGNKSAYWIINRSDITAYTSGSNQVTAITLATGAYAYKGFAAKDTIKGDYESQRNEGGIRFKHTVVATHLQSDAASFGAFNSLAKGEFVIVLQENNGKFRLYGQQAGLRATEKASTGGKPDDNYNNVITFEVMEPNPPIEVFVTSAVDTADYLDSLLD